MKTLTPEQADHIASVIDCEGYITLKGTKSPQVEVGITNTYRPLLEKFLAMLEIGRIHAHPDRRNPNWKTAYRLLIRGKEAESLLQQITPFLLAKQWQARAVLLFPRGNCYGISNNFRAARHLLFQAVKGANGKGITAPTAAVLNGLISDAEALIAQEPAQKDP